MTYSYRRTYRGPIQAALLDWAGTTMDFGCMAPAVVFVKVFERAGVPISMEEARAPMGAHKRVHIQKISELDGVKARWTATHGRPPGEKDVDRMFADFVPLQLDCLSEYSELIPGTLDVVRTLRGRGAKIGSTTGYLREKIEMDAKKQGYEPDSTVCASDVPAGRPYPYMICACRTSSTSRCRLWRRASRSTTRCPASRRGSAPACGRSASPSAATRSACHSPSGARWRAPSRRAGGAAPTNVCGWPAHTTSSTRSPTCSRASTTSPPGSRAASSPSGSPRRDDKHDRHGRRRRDRGGGATDLTATGALP